LIKGVLPRFPSLRVAVSATTRRMRPGESDGVHYHFLTDAEFARRVAAGDFLEHVVYAGNRYGTLRSEIDRILAEGGSPIVEIELAGARAVREAIPGAVSIFISPPSLEELVARLERRATDTAGEIAQRVRTSRVELEAMNEFDHRVVNADVDTAVEDLTRVLASVLGEAPRG
jgi:guanylate kinase